MEEVCLGSMYCSHSGDCTDSKLLARKEVGNDQVKATLFLDVVCAWDNNRTFIGKPNN